MVISGSQKRISASELATEIARMQEKATNDGPRYCQAPCPESRDVTSCDPVKAKLRMEISDNARLNVVLVHEGKSQPAATAEQLAD